MLDKRVLGKASDWHYWPKEANQLQNLFAVVLLVTLMFGNLKTAETQKQPDQAPEIRSKPTIVIKWYLVLPPKRSKKSEKNQKLR
jgi:hypothetical protein